MNKKIRFSIDVISVVKDNHRLGFHVVYHIMLGLRFLKHLFQRDSRGFYSSLSLGMISSSAGKGKGNYLPIRVNRRNTVGITTGLPSMTAKISCVHSQLPKHDLALLQHEVILLNLFRIIIIYL